MKSDRYKLVIMRMKPIVVVNDKFILHYSMLLVIHLKDPVTDYHIGEGCFRHLSFQRNWQGVGGLRIHKIKPGRFWAYCNIPEKHWS